MGSRVVETVEEAEAILRELWFGWFEGIYLEDEDRIREVVATEEQVEQARQQFGVMDFEAVPVAAAITFSATEILRSDSECLAVWSTLNLIELREGTSENVHVLRRHDGRWLHLGLWTHRRDLWESDCDSAL
jgi:hypothetical protein